MAWLLRNTEKYPFLSNNLMRIWFEGFKAFEVNVPILEILNNAVEKEIHPHS